MKALDTIPRSRQIQDQKPITSQATEPKTKPLTKPKLELANRILAAAFAEIEKHTPDKTTVSQTVTLLPWQDKMDEDYNMPKE